MDNRKDPPRPPSPIPSNVVSQQENAEQQEENESGGGPNDPATDFHALSAVTLQPLLDNHPNITPNHSFTEARDEATQTDAHANHDQSPHVNAMAEDAAYLVASPITHPYLSTMDSHPEPGSSAYASMHFATMPTSPHRDFVPMNEYHHSPWEDEYLRAISFPDPDTTHPTHPGYPPLAHPSPYAQSPAVDPTDTLDDRKPAATSKKDRKDSKKMAPRRKRQPRKRSMRSPRKRNSRGSSSSSSNSPDENRPNDPISTFLYPDEEDYEHARTTRDRNALESWHRRLRELVTFIRENGHAQVPQRHGPKLGIWVNKQRMEKKAYDQDQKSSMTPKKIDKLNRVGFEWAKPKGVANWNRNFEQLKAYLEKHGNANVPTKYDRNRALGRWVSSQRHMYKCYQKGTTVHNLSREETERRIGELNSVGFAWVMTKSDSQEGEHAEDAEEDAENDAEDKDSDDENQAAV